MTTTRRNIMSLSPAERSAFIAAINAMKQDGTYDGFTERHHMNMMVKTPGSGAYASSTRNRGHRGPAFGPWHRWFLLEFESALAQHGFGFVPYWRWEQETGSWTGTRTGIWSIMGGTGTVTDPFPDWHARLWNSSTASFTSRSSAGIQRQLGSAVPELPVQADVDGVNASTKYDTSPCGDTAKTVSFRNGLEGWLLRPGQKKSMHNGVHSFIGGDMGVGTSPNDPLFWVNHANVDRLWWAWQQLPGIVNYPKAGTGFPVGHGLNDVFQFLSHPNATPAGALDSHALGVHYDTES